MSKDELIELYKKVPIVLKNHFVEVVSADRSLSKQIQLTRTNSGNYWVVGTYLLPKSTANLTSLLRTSLEVLFRCNGDRELESFTLVEPAIVKYLPEKECWELIEAGLIYFGKHSETEKLEQKLSQIQEENKELRDRVNSLEAEKRYFIDLLAEEKSNHRAQLDREKSFLEKLDQSNNNFQTNFLKKLDERLNILSQQQKELLEKVDQRNNTFETNLMKKLDQKLSNLPTQQQTGSLQDRDSQKYDYPEQQKQIRTEQKPQRSLPGSIETNYVDQSQQVSSRSSDSSPQPSFNLSGSGIPVDLDPEIAIKGQPLEGQPIVFTRNPSGRFLAVPDGDRWWLIPGKTFKQRIDAWSEKQLSPFFEIEIEGEIGRFRVEYPGTLVEYQGGYSWELTYAGILSAKGVAGK